jgi:hypothetical protein
MGDDLKYIEMIVLPDGTGVVSGSAFIRFLIKNLGRAETEKLWETWSGQASSELCKAYEDEISGRSGQR